jgi:hypothetical protein
MLTKQAASVSLGSPTGDFEREWRQYLSFGNPLLKIGETIKR